MRCRPRPSLPRFPPPPRPPSKSKSHPYSRAWGCALAVQDAGAGISGRHKSRLPTDLGTTTPNGQSTNPTEWFREAGFPLTHTRPSGFLTLADGNWLQRKALPSLQVDASWLRGKVTGSSQRPAADLRASQPRCLPSRFLRPSAPRDMPPMLAVLYTIFATPRSGAA